MSARAIPLAEYEAELYRVGECLAHPRCKNARHIYQKRHGSIGDSLLAVCHTCDNPWCLNDSHHFLGTWKDNVMDAVIKGRHSIWQPEIREAARLGRARAVLAGAYKNNGGYKRGTSRFRCAELVEIKRLLLEHTLISRVASLCGRSTSTVHRVKSGFYDGLLFQNTRHHRFEEKR